MMMTKTMMLTFSRQSVVARWLKHPCCPSGLGVSCDDKVEAEDVDVEVEVPAARERLPLG